MSSASDRALHTLLDVLRARNYRFTTPTPATQARVLARKPAVAGNLRDVFGWSLPFDAAAVGQGGAVGQDIVRLLDAGAALVKRGALFASALRVSTCGEDFYLHSAYPTEQHDAVFFGPDSYRFASFLRAELARLGPRAHLVDLGAGAGVGAITAARAMPQAHVTLIDINRAALRLAAINWAANGFPFGGVTFAEGDGLKSLGEGAPIDCIIANPPYIVDAAHRAYRDGGALHGGKISLDWARAAGERLAPGGVFLLYTGSAIVDGEDRLRAALDGGADGGLGGALSGFDVAYREIDPDVFGEELAGAAYGDVERIAVVGVVATKR